MTTPTAQQVVTFRLGEDRFAADIFAVERVLRWSAPTPVPSMPAWIEGVVDYQGRVIPVIDLRRRFGLPAREARPETRLIVFAIGDEWIGGVVDAVHEVMTLDAKQLVEPPPLFRGLAGEYLRGLVRTGERLIIFLDVHRLLTTTEQLTLLRAMEEEAPDA